MTDPSDHLSWLQADLARLDQSGLRRQRRQVSQLPGGWCEVDGRRLRNFASNDYLNLAYDPRVLAAAREALDVSVGATASVTGAGCAANVALTFPSTISVSGVSMAAGTTSCIITINSITHVAGGNPDCSTNPAAFTNGATSISGLASVINSVTNQCLTVATQNGVRFTVKQSPLRPAHVIPSRTR